MPPQLLWPQILPKPVEKKHNLKATLAGEDDPPRWRDDILELPNGFQIAIRVWGDVKDAADKPQDRWIALHGWADNAATFDRLAPLMLRHGGSTCPCMS